MILDDIRWYWMILDVVKIGTNFLMCGDSFFQTAPGDYACAAYLRFRWGQDTDVRPWLPMETKALFKVLFDVSRILSYGKLVMSSPVKTQQKDLVSKSGLWLTMIITYHNCDHDYNQNRHDSWPMDIANDSPLFGSGARFRPSLAPWAPFLGSRTAEFLLLWCGSFTMKYRS